MLAVLLLEGQLDDHLFVEHGTHAERAQQENQSACQPEANAATARVRRRLRGAHGEVLSPRIPWALSRATLALASSTRA